MPEPNSTPILEPCMEIFLESIKSDSAKKSYNDAMRYFKDFVGLETFQEIVDMDAKKIPSRNTICQQRQKT